jgi:peroxiredoxin Q/BCP
MKPILALEASLAVVPLALVFALAALRPAGGAEPLKVGDPAPRMTLRLDDGKTLDLAAAKRAVVLYFYPKDDTPGCTKEACTYRDRTAEVEKAGALVVGISFDGAESHKVFRAKYKLDFALATDDGSVAEAFGVKVKDVLGAKYHARDTVVIGADGKIRAILRGVDPVKSVDEVLAALK